MILLVTEPFSLPSRSPYSVENGPCTCPFRFSKRRIRRNKPVNSADLPRRKVLTYLEIQLIHDSLLFMITWVGMDAIIICLYTINTIDTVQILV